MRSVVGSTSELDDLVQSALEQVVKSSSRFEGRARLSTFTYRICVHVALNHWRFWRRCLRRFNGSDDATRDALRMEDMASVPERLEEAERWRRLHAALDRLSPIKRIVVTLADLEELPASRIAEILECPEPTVRSRLAQARRDLYEALRGDPLFGEECR
jgi:RNA polymerase sigma-70 factor (ECF subfamily)